MLQVVIKILENFFYDTIYIIQNLYNNPYYGRMIFVRYFIELWMLGLNDENSRNRNIFVWYSKFNKLVRKIYIASFKRSL